MSKPRLPGEGERCVTCDKIASVMRCGDLVIRTCPRMVGWDASAIPNAYLPCRAKEARG